MQQPVIFDVFVTGILFPKSKIQSSKFFVDYNKTAPNIEDTVSVDPSFQDRYTIVVDKLRYTTKGEVGIKLSYSYFFRIIWEESDSDLSLHNFSLHLDLNKEAGKGECLIHEYLYVET